jgi:hypothetical protein
MTHRDQRPSPHALSGVRPLGAGASGLRLRLTQGLPAGLIVPRLARGFPATGKLRLPSPALD